MRRRGFTLVELLVAIAIILVMVTLASVAASAARTSARETSTRALIERLSGVLMQHLQSYDSRPIDMSGLPSGMSASAYRAWFIRRNLITGDMPDRWTDVAYMAAPANGWVPQSAAQRTYIAIWNSLTAAQQALVQANNSSAECLFLVVMRGGIGDCLGCGPLQNAQIGDQDGDGMPEFWDSWNNPIGFLLWAPAVELPATTSQRFFAGPRALDADPFAASGTIRPTLGMRPLIYSTGIDGQSGLDRTNETVTLSMGTSPVGRDCGNPLGAASNAGGPSTDANNPATARADNITNLDTEARQ
jgi:prepilin-type N-terminal cleavage/methylation domain-containing protein